LLKIEGFVLLANCCPRSLHKLNSTTRKWTLAEDVRLDVTLPLVAHDLVRHDSCPDIHEHAVPVPPFIQIRGAWDTSSAVIDNEEKITVLSTETSPVSANVHFVRLAVLVLKMLSPALAHWGLALAAHHRIARDRTILGVPTGLEGFVTNSNTTLSSLELFRHPRSFGDRLFAKFASLRANGPPNSPVANKIEQH
jgi:hypothetical protein